MVKSQSKNNDNKQGSNGKIPARKISSRRSKKSFVSAYQDVPKAIAEAKTNKTAAKGTKRKKTSTSGKSSTTVAAASNTKKSTSSKSKSKLRVAHVCPLNAIIQEYINLGVVLHHPRFDFDTCICPKELIVWHALYVGRSIMFFTGGSSEVYENIFSANASFAKHS